jgi:hypothetical protein
MMTGPRNTPSSPNACKPPKIPTSAKRHRGITALLTCGRRDLSLAYRPPCISYHRLRRWRRRRRPAARRPHSSLSPCRSQDGRWLRDPDPPSVQVVRRALPGELGCSLWMQSGSVRLSPDRFEEKTFPMAQWRRLLRRAGAILCALSAVAALGGVPMNHGVSVKRWVTALSNCLSV